MKDGRSAAGAAEERGPALAVSGDSEAVPIDTAAEPLQEEVEEARLAYVSPGHSPEVHQQSPSPSRAEAAENAQAHPPEDDRHTAPAGSTQAREPVQQDRSASPSLRGNSEERGRSPVRSRSRSPDKSRSRSRSRSRDRKRSKKERRSRSDSSSSRDRRRRKRRRRSYSTSSGSGSGSSRSRSRDGRHRHRGYSSRDGGYRDHRDREQYGSRSGYGGGGYGGGGNGGGYNRASQPWRQGDWGCNSCRSHNFASRNSCYQCGDSKPASAGGYGGRSSYGGGDSYGSRSGYGGMRSMGASGQASSSGTPQNFKPGDWMCPGCRTHNFASRGNCFRCQAPKA